MNTGAAVFETQNSQRWRDDAFSFDWRLLADQGKTSPGSVRARKERTLAFNRAIDRLLLDAGIPRYYQGCWFLDCRLEKTILFVPDRESGQSIVKLFGAQLKAVMPDLSIKVEVATKPAPPPKPSAMKQSWHRMQEKQQRLTEDS